MFKALETLLFNKDSQKFQLLQVKSNLKIDNKQ